MGRRRGGMARCEPLQSVTWLRSQRARSIPCPRAGPSTSPGQGASGGLFDEREELVDSEGLGQQGDIVELVRSIRNWSARARVPRQERQLLPRKPLHLSSQTSASKPLELSLAPKVDVDDRQRTRGGSRPERRELIDVGGTEDTTAVDRFHEIGQCASQVRVVVDEEKLTRCMCHRSVGPSHSSCQAGLRSGRGVASTSQCLPNARVRFPNASAAGCATGLAGVEVLEHVRDLDEPRAGAVEAAGDARVEVFATHEARDGQFDRLERCVRG